MYVNIQRNIPSRCIYTACTHARGDLAVGPQELEKEGRTLTGGEAADLDLVALGYNIEATPFFRVPNFLYNRS